VTELQNNGPEAQQIVQAAATSRQRSVYLPLVRGVTPTVLEVFDFAEQGMVTGRRDVTTVPSQALYLLNDPFVRKQSLALANRLLAETTLDDKARVDRAYRLILGRAVTAAEIERATGYLADIQTVVQESFVAPTRTAAPTEAVAVTDGDTPADDSKASSKPVDDADADAPVSEETLPIDSPAAAAWASFCQALFASAEFRYLK
jgi:hypothetical protein